MPNQTHDLRDVTLRPVLYLDLDDTLISWAGGTPHAGPGAREFLLWAMNLFEVRWLTTWCPGGEMEPSLLADLARMLELDPVVIEHIRGFDWDATESKLNGLAWLEHAVLGRPFLWIEDEYGCGEPERRFLVEHGFIEQYRHCNVTEDSASLRSLHAALENEWEAGSLDWTAGAENSAPWARAAGLAG